MTAAISRQGGDQQEPTAAGHPRCQVPTYSCRITGWGGAAESAPRPASQRRPAGDMRSLRGGHGPREREVLDAHSLTRLGYSFSTQSPHIATQLTGKSLRCFRQEETSRELRESRRMRPEYSPCSVGSWELIPSLRPLATIVRAGSGLPDNNRQQRVGL